ncbi:hypothetical protein ADL01_16135 [Streptomyces sp. NRRL WC-3618]|uniref:hypothetical protein n=1 Tax=Streptomyces sp. NRRL WC-3618 TaxID=1519490 RepID=UPI0006B004C7|nr:hypothetical protein [Streptomyces sp. NRRL WC-3618]KOV76819.1 hypothetical protein ADL01_16135 [Streptomyces sp. NRRL WC-3618]
MRKRITILAIAAVLPLTGVATLAATGTAGADPAKAKVTVQGSVDECDNGNPPEKVLITAPGVTPKDDDDPDMPNTGKYSITLTDVPKNKGKGVKALATVTCEGGGTYSKTFTLKRPPGTTTVQGPVNLESP